MFEIGWKEKALQQLDKLERSISSRILKSVEGLKEDPFSKDIKRLKGHPAFRLRVGDYRIIFEIENNKITILKVGHRRNIYG